jgi:hypothetical protein
VNNFPSRRVRRAFLGSVFLCQGVHRLDDRPGAASIPRDIHLSTPGTMRPHVSAAVHQAEADGRGWIGPGVKLQGAFGPAAFGPTPGSRVRGSMAGKDPVRGRHVSAAVHQAEADGRGWIGTG